MRRKYLKRVLALLTALTVAIGLTVPAVYAASDFNSVEKGSITVNIDSKVPVKEGITVNVYKVATADVDKKTGYITYEKTDLFKQNKDWVQQDIKLTSTKDEWPERAKTFAGYAAKEGFSNREETVVKDSEDKIIDYNYRSAETVNGSIKFEGLTRGLYLITVEPVKSGGKTYTVSPVLRCLPSLNDNKEWDPDQKINYPSSKIEEKSNGGSGGGDDTTTSITAQKVWKDEGQETDRPDSVTVELLRDGKVYASQKLSKSNNWRYTWTGLSNGNTWIINEVGAASDKYTVLTESEGNIFTITNTHTTDIDDPDTPLDPGPGGDPGTNGDIPPTNIEDPDVPLDPGQTPGGSATNIQDPANAAKLPQTGQLWWPVPILAAAGIAFFSIGWLRSRKDESEENK